MSTNKLFFTYYVIGIRVNLYKLYFLSSHFSPQPNKKVFHPFHFSTPPTKHTQRKNKSFLSSHFFILPPIFNPPIAMVSKPHTPRSRLTL